MFHRRRARPGSAPQGRPQRWPAVMMAIAATVAGVLVAPHADASVPVNSQYTSIAYNSNGPGYWVQVDGKGVTAAADAPAYGGDPSNPATIVANPAGDGYWLVQRNGTIQPYGKAAPLNSFPNKEVRVKKVYLSGGITAAAATPDGKGMFGVDTKGRLWTVGTAQPHGDVTRFIGDDYPVGIVSSPSGGGYWIVDSRGGLYGLGDAQYHGRVPQTAVDEVSGLAPSPGGDGYVAVTQAGALMTFGDAPALSSPVLPRGAAVTGIALNPAGGYALVREDGSVVQVALVGAPDPVKPCPHRPRPPTRGHC
jgi:hypothetical protein